MRAAVAVAVAGGGGGGIAGVVMWELRRGGIVSGRLGATLDVFCFVVCLSCQRGKVDAWRRLIGCDYVVVMDLLNIETTRMIRIKRRIGRVLKSRVLSRDSSIEASCFPYYC